MNEQITIKQTTDVFEVMRFLVPVLKEDELIELMQFNKRVLDRYSKENHS